MEFTSWFIGDLFNTINALANMSSSMAGSVINLLFLFVVFLLLFRAFTAFMHRKFGLAGLNILYVFIIGFLFLGAGTYYVNYVDVTGFVEDDSSRLNGTSQPDSTRVQVNGESKNGTVNLPATKDPDKARYRLDHIPHMYVIPAFMDEIAVSLATAAGLDRTGNYYTLAVMRDPSVVFTMAANQMIADNIKGTDVKGLCIFYTEAFICFLNDRDPQSDEMINACREYTGWNESNFAVIKSSLNVCSGLLKQYGQYMETFLNQTIKQQADKGDSTYKAIYDAYIHTANQLELSGKPDALPPPVRSQIQSSISGILSSIQAVLSKEGGTGGISRALVSGNPIVHLIQYLGMSFKEFLASIGESWLVQTLLIQNELVIFLSFYLLPLIILVTFLTNNFKYLTEYAFGYLLLKMQLPLWVVGHYLATGHVFNNLLASPTMNGFLIELVQNGDVNNSALLTNTITAGITSLGIGSLFLFGKSAAGGIQQGVAAGREILSGAMEVIKTTAAIAGAAVGGVAGLAGVAGGALGGLGGAAGAAGSAAGSAASGASSVLGAASNALMNIAGSGGSLSQTIVSASRGIGGIVNAIQESRLAQMSAKTLDVITNKTGQYFVDSTTGRLEGMRFNSPTAVNDFIGTLEKEGYETRLRKNGDIFTLTVKNDEGMVRYISKDGGRSFEIGNTQENEEDEKQISIKSDIFKVKTDNKDSDKDDKSNIILPGDSNFRI